MARIDLGLVKGMDGRTLSLNGIQPDANGNLVVRAADVDAAPDGYGLGKQEGKSIPINADGAFDFNLATDIGWYHIYHTYADTSYVNGPTTTKNVYGYSFMRVERYRYIVQTLYLCYQVESPLVVRRMSHVDSTDEWYDWEWENPPMELGVEYRTTERYEGKPVYAMTYDFGANTDGMVVYCGDNVDSIVRGVVLADAAFPYPQYNGHEWSEWSGAFQFLVAIDPADGASKAKVMCYAGSSMSGSYPHNKIVLHYTKTAN